MMSRDIVVSALIIRAHPVARKSMLTYAAAPSAGQPTLEVMRATSVGP
jgi:hypothetical protein